MVLLVLGADERVRLGRRRDTGTWRELTLIISGWACNMINTPATIRFYKRQWYVLGSDRPPPVSGDRWPGDRPRRQHSTYTSYVGELNLAKPIGYGTHARQEKLKGEKRSMAQIQSIHALNSLQEM